MNVLPSFARRIAPCLLLFAFAVSGFSPARAGEPLTIAVSQSPLSLPLYVAEQEGYFAAEGVGVKFNEVIGGHRTLQLLLAGEVHLATSSDAVVMFNSFKSKDFAVLATFVTSGDDVKLMARPGAGISTPNALVGKRVGTVVGSASHYFVDNLLLFHGIDPVAVTLVNLQPEAMAAALKNGEVDAIAAWEPYPFKAMQSVPGAVMLRNQGSYLLTFNLLAQRKLLGVRDDDMVRVLRALERAQGFIKERPQQAQAILRGRLKLEQAFIDWMWPRYNYRLSLDQSLLTTLESEARWARLNKLATGAAPNYLDFIHAGPLRKVSPAAVGLVD